MTGLLGFEPRSSGPKTRCLTAWLQPNIMGRLMGFEPTNAGATIRCVNRFATIAVLAGVVGLEPTLTVLETAVLPIKLYPYKQWWRGRDSNSRTQRERIYSPSRLATSLPLHKSTVEWWLGTESNRRHKDFQSFALPTELPSQSIFNC